ncbi:MAG: acetylxylan esterase, partial [Kiritimatiellae bacterium]|nr:acetylxylan esterase [Kiritimatiellia bacterium]
PADFDAFWRDAKAEVSDPSLPAGSLAPPSDRTAFSMPGFRVAAFLVPLGAGRAPAAGWVAWPSAASARSLPMVVRFEDYGLGPDSFPPDFDRGALFVSVHPHGFPADWDREKRIDAFNAVSNGGRGGAYGFRDAENADPKTCYFRGMVQRGLAALRFAKTLPQWDGTRITLAGRGQGAFQAVACAALDGDATFCRISAPWLCGLGLDTSWQPHFQPSLRYFDTVNFARRVRCPVQIDADLVDTAHSPAGAARLFSALAGPRRIVFRQGGSSETAATRSAGDDAAADAQ